MVGRGARCVGKRVLDVHAVQTGKNTRFGGVGSGFGIASFVDKKMIRGLVLEEVGDKAARRVCRTSLTCTVCEGIVAAYVAMLKRQEQQDARR